MEGNIYIDFYEQNSIPRGRLRIGRYVGFIVVMLSRRLIAYYFLIHSWRPEVAVLFIYLLVVIQEMESRGIIESNVLGCFCCLNPIKSNFKFVLFSVVYFIFENVYLAKFIFKICVYQIRDILSDFRIKSSVTMHCSIMYCSCIFFSNSNTLFTYKYKNV